MLLPARSTRAVYKIDPGTGGNIWRLGGKRSDFKLGATVRLAWQHDAGSARAAGLRCHPRRALCNAGAMNDGSRRMRPGPR